MALTLVASFLTLKQNLEITELQAETVSTRQIEVRAAVEAELTVLDSFLTGSYAKETLIAPLRRADIDIFVVLAAQYHHRFGPRDLLTEVRRVLRQRYPRTPEINPDGQAVTIEFTDFKVDVVPAFYRQGGGYLIADADAGSWISTDPKVHLQLMREANASHGGDLVPLVKMLKGWSRSHGDVLRGFYLELLALDHLSNVRISDFPSGVRWLLDKGREAVKYKIVDPAGFGDQVNGLRRIPVQRAAQLFEESYALAARAEVLEQAGRTADAVDTWKRLFGEYFPAYG